MSKNFNRVIRDALKPQYVCETLGTTKFHPADLDYLLRKGGFDKRDPKSVMQQDDYHDNSQHYAYDITPAHTGSKIIGGTSHHIVTASNPHYEYVTHSPDEGDDDWYLLDKNVYKQQHDAHIHSMSKHLTKLGVKHEVGHDEWNDKTIYVPVNQKEGLEGHPVRGVHFEGYLVNAGNTADASDVDKNVSGSFHYDADNADEAKPSQKKPIKPTNKTKPVPPAPVNENSPFQTIAPETPTGGTANYGALDVKEGDHVKINSGIHKGKSGHAYTGKDQYLSIMDQMGNHLGLYHKTSLIPHTEHDDEYPAGGFTTGDTGTGSLSVNSAPSTTAYESVTSSEGVQMLIAKRKQDQLHKIVDKKKKKQVKESIDPATAIGGAALAAGTVAWAAILAHETSKELDKKYPQRVKRRMKAPVTESLEIGSDNSDMFSVHDHMFKVQKQGPFKGKHTLYLHHWNPDGYPDFDSPHRIGEYDLSQESDQALHDAAGKAKELAAKPHHNIEHPVRENFITLRHVNTYTSKDGGSKQAKVYRDTEGDQFIVKHHKDGQYLHDKDTYHYDQKDAEDSASKSIYENFEPLTELSNRTLDSYIEKGTENLRKNYEDRDLFGAVKDIDSNDIRVVMGKNLLKKTEKNIEKRKAGLKTAVKKFNSKVDENFGPHNRSTNIDHHYLEMLLKRGNFEHHDKNWEDLHAHLGGEYEDHNNIGFTVEQPHRNEIGHGHSWKVRTSGPFKEAGFDYEKSFDDVPPETKTEIHDQHVHTLHRMSNYLHYYNIRHEIANDERGESHIYVPIDQSHLAESHIVEDGGGGAGGAGAGGGGTTGGAMGGGMVGGSQPQVTTNTTGSGAVAGMGVNNPAVGPNQGEPGVRRKKKKDEAVTVLMNLARKRINELK